MGLPVEEIKSRKEKILEKLKDVKDYVIFQKQKYGEIDERLFEVRSSIEENDEKQLKIKNEDTKSKKEREKNEREKNKLENERKELILQKEELEMIGKLDYTAMQNTLLQPVNDKIDKNHILFSIQFLDWRRVVGIGKSKKRNEIKVDRTMDGTTFNVNVARSVSKFNAYTLEEIPLELQNIFFDGEKQQTTIDNDDMQTIVEDNYRKEFKEDWNGVDKNERDKIFEKESDESWESYYKRMIEREQMSKEDNAERKADEEKSMAEKAALIEAYVENVRKKNEEDKRMIEREQMSKEDKAERKAAEERKRKKAERKRSEKKLVLSDYDNKEDIPLSDNTDSDDFPEIIMDDVDDDSDDDDSDFESDDDFPDIII